MCASSVSQYTDEYKVCIIKRVIETVMIEGKKSNYFKLHEWCMFQGERGGAKFLKCCWNIRGKVHTPPLFLYPQYPGRSLPTNGINIIVNINILRFALYVHFKIPSIHLPGPHPRTPLLYQPVPTVDALGDYSWMGLKCRFFDIIYKGATKREQGQPVKAIEHQQIRLKIEIVYTQVRKNTVNFGHFLVESLCHTVMK